MIRTILVWGFFIAIAVWVITDPAGSSDFVVSVISGIVNFFKGLIEGITNLFRA